MTSVTDNRPPGLRASNISLRAAARSDFQRALDLEADQLEVVVGDGREALLNYTLLLSELAQPSGLYYADGLLYFADSESSSIRVADFTTGVVRTLAGPLENTLFDFGDVDGPVGVSRIQHPLEHWLSFQG